MPAPRVVLDLQELGDRALPSAVAPPTATGLGVAAAASPAHPLHGAGTGTYLSPRIVVDAGTSFALAGMADLGALGSFRVTGSVQGVGFVASGRATGQLVLSNAHGTITLALHGGVQPGFSQIPPELVYAVAGGTGDFAHLGGYGTVGVHRVPAPTAVGQPQTGVVTLNFS